MMSAGLSTQMSAEEFEGLFVDRNQDRELIRGEVRERSMTIRNRRHTFVQVRLSYVLEEWRLKRPKPRGRVYAGEVGSILRRNPDTTVGIDVAYYSPEAVQGEPAETTLLEGPPVLAVEILSPSDSHEDISDKVREYLAAGVRLVWIVDPDFETVTVYRSDQPPQLYNNEHEILGDPVLPGLRISVSRLFGDE